MSPAEQGLRAALRLTRIELARERLRAARAEREAASLRVSGAEVEMELAQWASENGKEAPGLNGPSFRRWLRGTNVSS